MGIRFYVLSATHEDYRSFIREHGLSRFLAKRLEIHLNGENLRGIRNVMILNTGGKCAWENSNYQNTLFSIQSTPMHLRGIRLVSENVFLREIKKHRQITENPILTKQQ